MGSFTREREREVARGVITWERPGEGGLGEVRSLERGTRAAKTRREGVRWKEEREKAQYAVLLLICLPKSLYLQSSCFSPFCHPSQGSIA